MTNTTKAPIEPITGLFQNVDIGCFTGETTPFVYAKPDTTCRNVAFTAPTNILFDAHGDLDTTVTQFADQVEHKIKISAEAYLLFSRDGDKIIASLFGKDGGTAIFTTDPIDLVRVQINGKRSHNYEIVMQMITHVDFAKRGSSEEQRFAGDGKFRLITPVPVRISA